MSPVGISFQGKELVSFSHSELKNLRKWIADVAAIHGKKPGNILFNFMGDKDLIKINRDFLKHNALTDIITFGYPKEDIISGEIFISIDRVKENALKFKQPFSRELFRVIIHGILHLCGYSDKTGAKKKAMRKMEDEALKTAPDMSI